MTARLKELFLGKPKDPLDPRVFHNLSLIAFFAWIGLGADGLSSSCYGPEEAFLALGHYSHLAILLAIAVAATIAGDGVLVRCIDRHCLSRHRFPFAVLMLRCLGCGPGWEGGAGVRFRLENVGVSRERSEALQALLSAFILACGRVEKGGNRGLAPTDCRVDFPTGKVTSVI